ncbi:MAG: enoyl-CoA hydratase/isomerase family protein, partial [Pseudomonadales bacterium]
IRTALGGERKSLCEIATSLSELAGAGPWIDRGLETFSNGCPTSAGIIVEQIRRAPALDLDEGFGLELVIATHCARNSDFAEGIRALIIDKDNRARWRFDSVEDVDWSWVLAHFEPPWDENPLADLQG